MVVSSDRIDGYEQENRHSTKAVKTREDRRGRRRAIIGGGGDSRGVVSENLVTDPPPDAQFADDAWFAYPWGTGDFACRTCHNGQTTFNLDFPSSLRIHGG